MILVEFDFSELTFESNKTETEYLEHRKNRLNQYTEFKGNIWVEKYKESKNKLWQIKFVNELNKRLVKDKKNVVFTLDSTNVDYKLIVRTKWMYLGYNIGIANEPAKLKIDFIFYDTIDSKNIISTLNVKRATGTNGNSIKKGEKFTYLKRIGNAYKKSAFMLYLVLKRFLN